MFHLIPLFFRNVMMTSKWIVMYVIINLVNLSCHEGHKSDGVAKPNITCLALKINQST